MKALWGCLAVCGVALAFAGCNGAPSTTPEEDAATATENQTLDSKADLKKRLTDIGTAGSAGSGLAAVKNTIDELQTSDAALGGDLAKDYEELQAADGAGNTAQVKAIATRMAGKL